MGDLRSPFVSALTSPDHVLLTPEPVVEGTTEVRLTADRPLVPGSGLSATPWTYEDGGGVKALQPVDVTASQVVLSLNMAAVTGPGYQVTYSPPPFQVNATDGGTLPAGSWSGPVTGPAP